jgi:probable F420-dependent oxidoreductase
MANRIKLGMLMPLGDIGGDPRAVKAFAQAAEELGFDDLAAPDHVLGVNVETRPDWGARNTSRDLFHDPFVLFGYLSGITRSIGFSTQVLILPQRQTVLVAKQAASLDVLCGGRFRLGVGVGWNEVEFIGLNENFKNRGRRSEEQVHVMQQLWAAPHVKFEGKYHHIDDAGINPLPTHRRVPVWYGGAEDVTLRRVARYGDGWMPNAFGPGDEARATFDTLRRYAAEEGRDPASIGLEPWVSAGDGSEADWHREAAAWKGLGVDRICLTTTFGRRGHKRIPGRTMSDHLAAMKRYREAVADVL